MFCFITPICFLTWYVHDFDLSNHPRIGRNDREEHHCFCWKRQELLPVGRSPERGWRGRRDGTSLALLRRRASVLSPAGAPNTSWRFHSDPTLRLGSRHPFDRPRAARGTLPRATVWKPYLVRISRLLSRPAVSRHFHISSLSSTYLPSFKNQVRGLIFHISEHPFQVFLTLRTLEPQTASQQLLNGASFGKGAPYP